MTLSGNLRYRIVAVGDKFHWLDRKTNEALTYRADSIDCEACERNYRLTSDGLHYNDARNGATWGVCRKLTMTQAQFNDLDAAIAAFVEGELTVSVNEELE